MLFKLTQFHKWTFLYYLYRNGQPIQMNVLSIEPRSLPLDDDLADLGAN